MKRLLLTLAAALLFLNAFVVPTMSYADGVPDGNGCEPAPNCKP